MEDIEALYLTLAKWRNAKGELVLEGLRDTTNHVMCGLLATGKCLNPALAGDCQGRGWIPVCDVNVLERSLRKAGYVWEADGTDTVVVKVFRIGLNFRNIGGKATANDFEHALPLATCAVAEKEQANAN